MNVKDLASAASEKKDDALEIVGDIIDSGRDKFTVGIDNLQYDYGVVKGAVSEVYDENKELATDVANELYNYVKGEALDWYNTGKQLVTDIAKGISNINIGELLTYGVGKVISDTTDMLEETNIVRKGMDTIVKYMKKTKLGRGFLGKAIVGTFDAIGDILSSTVTYKDGLSETGFGSRMAKSWAGEEGSFLNYFSKKPGVRLLNSTPLDSANGIYGTTVLGVPYTLGRLADPNNRVLMNTFIKDGRVLSLTPGLPKYNGGYYSLWHNNTVDVSESESNENVLSYLSRNGLDNIFDNKDKRYYTFQPKFAEYYSYLEAMLIPIWIKLGLGTDTDSEGNKTFNLFTFFNMNDNGNINLNGYNSLDTRYRSIGFYVNASGSITEQVSSSETSFGAENANSANNASERFQQLNYLTGMGTGNGFDKHLRGLGGTVSQISTLKEGLSDRFNSTKNAALSESRNFITKAAKMITAISADVAGTATGTDLSAFIQSFATANGMRVMYPELWSNSSYDRSVNINITFTSPYGDPLSIFQYVYVPFCALLCMALPRQADTNGYISPFFVRGDIPGLFTSDLAFISNMSWTKGGDSGDLWTKDGLPRAITCSFTINDLFKYLAMTKRYSYLAYNPSYTVFLDNMAGLHAINDDSDDPLNTYWDRMLRRVANEEVYTPLWNRYNKIKTTANREFGNKSKENITGKVRDNTVPWLNKI